MMRGKRKSFSGIPAGIGIGLLTGMIVTILTAIATAVLIAGERLGEDQAMYGAAAALLLGVFFGGLVAASVAGEKRMIVCLCYGAAFSVVLLSITALFFEGFYENIWATGLLILGTSAAAALVGLRKNSASFGSRKKRIRIP